MVGMGLLFCWWFVVVGGGWFGILMGARRDLWNMLLGAAVVLIDARVAWLRLFDGHRFVDYVC